MICSSTCWLIYVVNIVYTDDTEVSRSDTYEQLDVIRTDNVKSFQSNCTIEWDPYEWEDSEKYFNPVDIFSTLTFVLRSDSDSDISQRTQWRIPHEWKWIINNSNFTSYFKLIMNIIGIRTMRRHNTWQSDVSKYHDSTISDNLTFLTSWFVTSEIGYDVRIGFRNFKILIWRRMTSWELLLEIIPIRQSRSW